MLAVDSVLESLKNYGIEESDILKWEFELGLNIPMDEYGRRQYSAHHVNLFRNVKKHIALGRTLDEIRSLIALPPETDSKPRPMPEAVRAHGSAPSNQPLAKVSRPQSSGALARPSSMMPSSGSNQVVEMLERLMGEKEQLHGKLIETEKLNSHLYNANSMFHRKVKELNAVILQQKDQLKALQDEMYESANLKMMEAKAQMSAKLLETEKVVAQQKKEIALLNREIALNEEKLGKVLAQAREEYDELEKILDSRIQDLQQQLAEATQRFDTKRFLGDWEETAQLVEVAYDNFGINIEPERRRTFRISEVPEIHFGSTAIITTHYEYEKNSLWRRVETLTLGYLGDSQLEGQLVAEYIIDGVPVSKAIYRVQCKRIG